MADNRTTVEQFLQAMGTNDVEAQERLLSDDIVEAYPQSGERIRGKDNRRAIIENYPGGLARALRREGGRCNTIALTPRARALKLNSRSLERWGHTCSHPEHSSQAHQRRRYLGRRSPGK